MEFVAEVRHLSKRYGGHTVVDDLTFAIPRGHVVGLIGPNGAGKTTTMQMLLGLVTPTRGDITLLGTPVGANGWGNTLKRVGSMIEEPPIYQRMTARQNLQYQSLAVTGRIDDAAIDDLLTLVDLADRADDRPRAYSLGMKQRLGIAISLIGSPDLVVLDEPANGLDPAGIREIRRLLRRLTETGAAVLVSSHQLAEVQQACDQLVVLANGHLLINDSTDAILASRATREFTVTVTEAEVSQAALALRSAEIEVLATSGPTLIIEPGEGSGGVEINRTLVEAGIFASELTKTAVSLEDAFLDMVDPTTTESEGVLQ